MNSTKMNLTIGQRISTRGEDFIITNSNTNYDGSWLLEAHGISELVKGKRFTFDSNIDSDIKPKSRRNLRAYHHQKRTVQRQKNNLPSSF